MLLSNQAQSLHDAGLRRLNVSLDTLDAERFQAIARRDGLSLVLKGLQAAKRVGFSPIKVNAVALRETLGDAVTLAKYCRDEGFTLRFHRIDADRCGLLATRTSRPGSRIA